MRSDLKKQIVCLLLCMLITLPALNGCGSGGNTETESGNTETSPQETTPQETETTRANTKDSLPDDLDLGGATISILYRGCPADTIEV